MKEHRVSWAQWASMRRMMRTLLLTPFLAALTPLSGFTQTTATAEFTPQSFPLEDAATLSVIGGKAEPVEYLGRKAVRLTNPSQNNDIFAYVGEDHYPSGRSHARIHGHRLSRAS